MHHIFRKIPVRGQVRIFTCLASQMYPAAMYVQRFRQRIQGCFDDKLAFVGNRKRLADIADNLDDFLFFDRYTLL
jgi:hypothetical protein